MSERTQWERLLIRKRLRDLSVWEILHILLSGANLLDPAPICMMKYIFTPKNYLNNMTLVGTWWVIYIKYITYDQNLYDDW